MTSAHRPSWANSTTTAATAATDVEALVVAFFAALSRADLAELGTFLAPDVVYQNMPLPPAHGRDAVLATLEALYAAFSMDEIGTIHLASRDGYVFTERVDVLTARSTGNTYPLPVTGVTRVVGGAIVEWRDYFDLRDVEEALGLPLRA